MLLGLRAQESLLTTIKAEQLGYIYPRQLSDISIQRNPLNKELLLVGKIGISSELFDSDDPTFYVHVHRFRIGQLKDEYKKAANKNNSVLKHGNTRQYEEKTNINSLREN